MDGRTPDQTAAVSALHILRITHQKIAQRSQYFSLCVSLVRMSASHPLQTVKPTRYRTVAGTRKAPMLPVIVTLPWSFP